MNRALPALALLAALALALSVAGPPARALDVRPAALTAGDIYLALGDSLSTGDEAPANDDNLPGYPVVLNELLQATTPVSYTLLGVSGETTATMLAPGGQLDRAEAYIAARREAGERVGLVTLSVGGNDIVNVLRGGGATVTDTLELMRGNLGTILDRLVAATSDGGRREARILVMNYYNPYPGLTIGPPLIPLPTGQEPIVTDRDLPRFNQVLAEVAAERQIPVFDAFAAVRGNEAAYLFVRYPVSPLGGEAGLDYHPRAAGHLRLARGLAEAGQLFVPRIYLPAQQR